MELCDSGLLNPPSSLVMGDRSCIVQSLSLHQVVLMSKAEVDQFAEGIYCLGILDAIRKYPGLLQQFFVGSK